MTRTTPWRRITLHFSHIGLTEGRTFISLVFLLVAVRDAAAAEVVGRELDLHAVAGQDPDVVHPHLPGDVSEHLVPVLELDTEHRVRQRLHHRPLHEDRVVLGLGDRRHLPRIWRAERARELTGADRSGYSVERRCSNRTNRTFAAPAPARTGPETPVVTHPARVSTSGLSSVTAIVCSKCAERLPSAVITVQPSSSTSVSAVPTLTIDSIASTCPTFSRIPRPGGP